MKKKFAIAFIAACVCFTILYATVFSSIFEKEPAEAITDDPSQPTDQLPGDDDEEDDDNEILFLLMGVDSKDVTKSKGTRTDTMMLTSVNLETGKISLFSIPRDTRVYVNGKLNKINAAHAIGGAEMTIDTVKDFLGIDLEYYVKVDYQIVQDVVKSIGGIVIDVPLNMRYVDPTADPPLDINLKKGVQTLDGKQAHDFLRWRHNNAMTVGYPEGDVGRIAAQQYFMKELVKQTLQPKNILKLPSLVKTYYNNVETNIPLTVMLKGVTAANKIDVENMTTATLPGDGQYVGDVSYFIYDKEAAESVVKEMFGNYLLD